MQQLLWLFILPLALGMNSCAADNDDFLSKNDKEVSDLRNEDIAIRAELKKQIEFNRNEFNKKINALENTLKQLIDEGGQSIYDKLATKMKQTKKLINDKFDNFDTTVDAKLPGLMNSLERSSTKLNKILATKKAQLTTAIAENNKEKEELIKTEIAKISALQTKMATVKARIETFKTQLEQLEQTNAAMVEIEQSVSSLQEKYKGQAAVFEKVNGQIRKIVNETFEKLTSSQLNIYNEQLAKVKTLTEEMLTKIDDFKELADKFDQIKAKYDNALSDGNAQELIDKVEDLELRFAEVERLMGEFESAPNPNDFDIEDISEPLDNMEEIEEGDLVARISSDVSVEELESLKQSYESEAAECEILLGALDDLINEYNDIRDSMFDED